MADGPGGPSRRQSCRCCCSSSCITAPARKQRPQACLPAQTCPAPVPGTPLNRAGAEGNPPVETPPAFLSTHHAYTPATFVHYTHFHASRLHSHATHTPTPTSANGETGTPAASTTRSCISPQHRPTGTPLHRHEHQPRRAPVLPFCLSLSPRRARPSECGRRSPSGRSTRERPDRGCLRNTPVLRTRLACCPTAHCGFVFKTELFCRSAGGLYPHRAAPSSQAAVVLIYELVLCLRVHLDFYCH